YFDLYDLAPVGYVTISEEGLILEANLTAAILLGAARRTALLKQPLSRFILKEDQDIYYQHRKDLSETNHHARRREQQSLDISFGLRSGQADESHAWELRMVKMDGTSFWAHLEATATQNTSMNSGQAYHGEPTCRIVMIDITEQKQVEKALLHDRIFVEALFESVPGMLYVYDDQGNHIRHNKKHEEMTGYSGEELSQLNPLSWYDDKADIVRVEAAINDVFTTGYGEVEVPMRIKNGEKLFMHFTGSRLILDGKKYFVGVGIDINARKQAEEELFKQKSLLSSIIESSSEAIFAKDTDGKYRSINEAGARMLGYGVKDVIGRTDMELLHAETAREFRKTDEDVMSSGQVYEREEIGIIDGKTCIFLAHKAPWRGNSGEIIGIIGVSSDISERKWAEEEKANLEAQIQQAQKMESVGRLAGGVAHDFNNMLGVIIGHTEMALDQVEPAQPIHADLEEILTAANRSADLTRQLLAFARKQTIAPKVLDLNKTVTGMLKMLRRLIGEDIHLNWQPDANLWPVRVDPSQIDQILANLCVNARDAISDIGKMTIETGNSAFDEDYCAAYAGFVPGEYVLLAVSDNGCGMDKETLSHLFEPFYTTKVMGKGTGLGLATVYGIVRQNNGFI
ncbi:MAG: PAS domain S-box protein, partial [Syntrophus sp. (in: bacteria)]